MNTEPLSLREETSVSRSRHLGPKPLSWWRQMLPSTHQQTMECLITILLLVLASILLFTAHDLGVFLLLFRLTGYDHTPRPQQDLPRQLR